MSNMSEEKQKTEEEKQETKHDDDEDEEEDLFYKRIDNSGCAKQHYELQVSFFIIAQKGRDFN